MCMYIVVPRRKIHGVSKKRHSFTDIGRDLIESLAPFFFLKFFFLVHLDMHIARYKCLLT